MTASDWLSIGLTLVGAFFFLAGTVGLLRFPDVYTRLHALTKADNMGLGLTVVGLIVQLKAWTVALELILIWLLALFASATLCNLIAQAAMRAGVRAWKRP